MAISYYFPRTTLGDMNIRIFFENANKCNLNSIFWYHVAVYKRQ